MNLLLEGTSFHAAARARVATEAARVAVEQWRVLRIVGVAVPVPVRHDALVAALVLQSLLKFMNEVAMPGEEVSLHHGR